MKKILHIFVLLLTTLLLVSCQVERIETTTGEVVEQTTTKEEVITTTTKEEIVTTTTTEEVVTTTTTEEPISIKELIIAYLKEISESFGASPYSFIPDPMKPAYKANLVSAESINYDFSDFVNKEDIVYGGFGEQWNMVIENIDDSEKFYNTLLKGDTAFSTAISLLKDYIEASNDEDVNKTLENSNYEISLVYLNDIVTINLKYLTKVDNQLFGAVNPEISFIYNIEENTKDVLVKISDTNKLRYRTSENKYEFAIEYGINQASRTAYAVFEKESDALTKGHIYEYITAGEKDVVKSCADFYITDEYVSVVGNKASGLIGFTGYINELYNVKTGKLLGYEVQEELSILSVKGVYHTYWFNLSDVSGITQVKELKDQDDKDNDGIYINGKTTKFTPTYNTKKILGKTVNTSRKYDIEFRIEYVYSYDRETDKYAKHKIEVPMLFVQADNENDTNFTDYPTDVLAANGIVSNVTLSKTILDKIQSDHNTYIEIFIRNKENMSSEAIKTFIEG